MCPATTMAHTGTDPIELQTIQVEPKPEPGPPSYASLDIPTILKKDPRFYTPADRHALSRHNSQMKGKEGEQKTKL